MKAISVAESLTVVTILTILSIAPAVAAPDAPGSDVNSLLAEVRRATAKYHDETVALADGYVSTVECVEAPGLGGMGIHYVNFALADPAPPVGSVDELTPEILLYAPIEGGVRLVGVEYSALALANTPDGPAPWFDPITPPPLGWFTTAPTLFIDQLMHGPMPGHEPEQPWHYDLHAWVWQANPNGVFEDFNPTVSCDE